MIVNNFFLTISTYRIFAKSFCGNYSFLKVRNVEIFIYFPHYGKFLLHKLKSCRGNYSREETIRENTVCTYVLHFPIFAQCGQTLYEAVWIWSNLCKEFSRNFFLTLLKRLNCYLEWIIYDFIKSLTLFCQVNNRT